jgi:HNH endonuclease
LELRYLQVDHRVPYEVAGDLVGTLDLRDFMLICGSCNRTKSWSCEHCPNWLQGHKPDLCKTCYWGSPEKYTHIATLPIRRLDATWKDDEVAEYDHVAKLAKRAGQSVAEYVKSLVKDLSAKAKK